MLRPDLKIKKILLWKRGPSFVWLVENQRFSWINKHLHLWILYSHLPYKLLFKNITARCHATLPYNRDFLLTHWQNVFNMYKKCSTMCHDWKYHCHAGDSWANSSSLSLEDESPSLSTSHLWGCEENTKRKWKKTLKEGTPQRGHSQSPMEP